MTTFRAMLLLVVLYSLPPSWSFSLHHQQQQPRLPSRYLRWQQTGNIWNMQTAVTTLKHAKNDTVVELHGMLHLGTPQYFEYYNSRTFNTRHDKILYELLVDDELLEEHGSGHRFLLPTRDYLSPIQASEVDRNTARTYGWTCQADTVHYAQSPDWIHADVTRQELQDALQPKDNGWTTVLSQGLLGRFLLKNDAPATVAVTALLVGPPLLQDTPSQRRRLFSTLSLPAGDSWATALAYLLRSVLWLTVPCPELSVLLVDWSTLLLLPTTTTGDDRTSTTPGLSPLTTPLMQALWSGDWSNLRRLLFGQVVTSRQRAAQADNLLIRQRNDRALQVLRRQVQTSRTEPAAARTTTADTTVSTDSNDDDDAVSLPPPTTTISPKPLKVALLYGCSHCLDLQAKLVAEGYQVVEPTTWRTAWSVVLQPSILTRRRKSSSNNDIRRRHLGPPGAHW